MKNLSRMVMAIILMLPLFAFSQLFPQSTLDTIPQLDRIGTGNPELYSALQTSWKANDAPSYITGFPYIQSIGERRIPLTEGEGKNGPFNILEANINLRYTVAMGRPSSNGFWRRGRITFDYNPVFRMLMDDSRPLTPMNQRVGIGLDYAVWDNYRGWLKRNRPADGEKIIVRKQKALWAVNFRFQAHHYSNGQPPGFFYPSDTLPPDQRRNDYQRGDFSTNYLYFQPSLMRLKKDVMQQWSFGVRFDGEIENSPLIINPAMIGSYGQYRLVATYDFRSGPKYRKRATTNFEKDGHYYCMRKGLEWHVRLQYTYIGGDMSNFLPNLANDVNQYRHTLSAQLELNPFNHRSVGYFIQAFVGRDYLNIRYDDIIYSVQAGITLTMDKYYPPTFDSRQTVSKIGRCD